MDSRQTKGHAYGIGPLLAWVAGLVLAGCASQSPPPGVAQPQPAPEKQVRTTPPPPAVVSTRHQTVFDDGLVLVYEVETKRSSIDGKSCYSFITGTLENGSDETLGRQTAVQFKVFQRDRLLFEDYANLRTHLAPGNRVQFDIVQSPLYLKHCPHYDKIDVAMRKIALR
jgi:hypothetical protein